MAFPKRGPSFLYDVWLLRSEQPNTWQQFQCLQHQCAKRAGEAYGCCCAILQLNMYTFTTNQWLKERYWRGYEKRKNNELAKTKGHFLKIAGYERYIPIDWAYFWSSTSTMLVTSSSNSNGVFVDPLRGGQHFISFASQLTKRWATISCWRSVKQLT